MNDNAMIAKYKKYEPVFGSWYLKRFVGEGSFAKVFEIVRNDFGNEYVSALKIITVAKNKTEITAMRSEGMTDDDIRMNLRGIVEDTIKEIQLMYKLKGNTNIVGYEDHAVMEHEDGMGWDILIKMEYLTPLDTYIRQQKGRLTKREVIKLGIDICKALEECQKYNIIHRDIKADNIFAASNGNFKLGDFGIARVVERRDMELSKKGTSAYMAPEVYKGQTYTSAVDIYSLGIVLYRLLNNNRLPFMPPYPQPVSLDDRDRALMLRMSGEKYPKPAQVSSGRLPEIVMKACAYRPADRYSGPVAMRQDLESILYREEEMTADADIMVYEEKDSGEPGLSGSTRQSAFDGQDAEYEATEVLREEPGMSPAAEPSRNINAARPEPYRQTTPVMQPAFFQAPQQRKCKNCGRNINSNTVFCPVCGVRQDAPRTPVYIPVGQPVREDNAIKRICVRCGAFIHADTVFCPVCGSSQKEAAQSQAVLPAAAHKGSSMKKWLLIGGCVLAAVIVVLLLIFALGGSGGSKPHNTSGVTGRDTDHEYDEEDTDTNGSDTKDEEEQPESVPAQDYVEGNLIENGNFSDGTAGWELYLDTGEGQMETTHDGRLRIDVTDSGDVEWDVQANYKDIPLEPGAEYELSFEVYCSKDFAFYLGIQENGGNWRDYYYTVVEVTNGGGTVDVTFVPNEIESDYAPVLILNLGNMQRWSYVSDMDYTVYFDNFVLKKIGDAQAPSQGSGQTPAPQESEQPPSSQENSPTTPPQEDGQTAPPSQEDGQTAPPPQEDGQTAPPPQGDGQTAPPPQGDGQTAPPPRQ